MRYLSRNQNQHSVIQSSITLPIHVKCSSTFVKSTPSLVFNNFPQALAHAVRFTLGAVSDVHPTLDRDVRVRNARSEQLPNRAEEKRVQGFDLPPLL